MKRASKTEKRIASQRQDDIAREKRAKKKRGYTEEKLNKALPSVPDAPKPKDKPSLLRKDADALDRDVHTLELENYRRRECGLPPMSYGQARATGILSKNSRAKAENKNEADENSTEISGEQVADRAMDR